jgi:hypothetical protein
MEKIIINNNNSISILLEEDENPLVTIKRNSINSIDKFFSTRVDEGFFEILINGHLNNRKTEIPRIFPYQF